MLDDLGGLGSWIAIAAVLVGEPLLPRWLVVVTAAKIPPSGLAGAGGDDLLFLFIGLGADELEEWRSCGWADVVIEHQNAFASSDGAITN